MAKQLTRRQRRMADRIIAIIKHDGMFTKRWFLPETEDPADCPEVSVWLDDSNGEYFVDDGGMLGMEWMRRCDAGEFNAKSLDDAAEFAVEAIDRTEDAICGLLRF